MAIGDFPAPEHLRPAARDKLAAAGPVEPSSSPDPAPGPTPLPAGPCARHMAAFWALSREGDADVPTLAFVPGIAITGRYRMLAPL